MFPLLRYVCILSILHICINYSNESAKCDETVDISDGDRLGTNITKDNVTYTKDDYFVDGNIIRGCVCNVRTCIRRCCASDEILTFNELNYTTSCKSSSNQNFNVTEDLKPVTQNISLFHIISVPNMFCEKEGEYRIFLNCPDYDLKIDQWGTLDWEGNTYAFEKYCASNIDGQLSTLVCVVPDSRSAEYFYCYGMIISMPFLLATFLVYAVLPDRNVHQRALMFYVLTLFISYILLVTVNLTNQLAPPGCEIIAYLTVFFFMVSFFWMNVICFDIWYTFSGGRGFVGSKRTSERRRFIYYSIYAWGVPFLHVVMVYVMQQVLPDESVHNPGIGVTKCFLADGWPNLWYFYLIAAIVVIANMVFFLNTALKIRQVKKETSMLKQNDSKRHAYEKDKQKFNLYLKLLLAMGVNWTMEVISWLVNWQTNNRHTEVWYVTDFFNAVYGVFIFFIFVFKKKIWKLLQKRYYTFIGKPHLAHTMTSTNTRTSHYSSTNYSTAETNLSDRGNGTRSEEMGLRRVT